MENDLVFSASEEDYFRLLLTKSCILFPWPLNIHVHISSLGLALLIVLHMDKFLFMIADPWKVPKYDEDDQPLDRPRRKEGRNKEV